MLAAFLAPDVALPFRDPGEVDGMTSIQGAWDPYALAESKASPSVSREWDIISPFALGAPASTSVSAPRPAACSLSPQPQHAVTAEASGLQSLTLRRISSAPQLHVKPIADTEPVPPVAPVEGDASRRVGVDDSRFTEAVKRYTGLPAYAAALLFQRAWEWEVEQCRLAALEKEGTGRPKRSRSCCSECKLAGIGGGQAAPGMSWARSTISPEAFVAIWPASHCKLRTEDALLALLGMKENGISVAAGACSGLSAKQLVALLQALCMRHPDLQFLSEDAAMRRAYCEYATTCLFATEGVFTRDFMSARQVRGSSLVDIMVVCACMPLDDVPALSPKAFRQVWDWYYAMQDGGLVDEHVLADR